ncbi:uncharacterized protein AC631_02719 [Debaryomyces fabryi]|uniref:ABC transporter domain-containing protein n=1 Tax=Debaryomyces fabryi TaxID=58627 RepID=A0A0V1PZE4_9ASCO|nr:uncharacterized protein AC631_02719 [Debaryomyces fabryi]KSA01498.1 hypothetical protein AC631_02719 [Debaryomyces fabryi]
MKVKSFEWSEVSLYLPAKRNEEEVCLLDNVSGLMKPGEIMALMGPSGSGKTTLLNRLSNRSNPKSSRHTGDILINNEVATLADLKEVSNYVEQEDSLVGSLTVKETVEFSAKFANIPKRHRGDLVNEIISLLGLENQKNLKIGTPLQKGISGGQKRRTSIASQVLGKPQILFLDEPTSGLDSVASREVINTLKKIAISEGIIVIASIHQPSTFTFQLFDKVMFLSKGMPIYNGRVSEIPDYFKSIHYEIPRYYNPSEFILDLINTDFSNSITNDEESTIGDKELIVNDLVNKWRKVEERQKAQQVDENYSDFQSEKATLKEKNEFLLPCIRFKNILVRESNRTRILLQRLLIKSRRDVLAYYVRIIMYLGLAVLMGTVWLRLNNNQDNIQPFTNAIFFSGAFMSFMSVAYIPSFIEDYNSYKKEKMNGNYGPFSFVLSNFIIGVPFLFIIALLFSIVTYFMCHFHDSSKGFGYYVMWLFLDLLAAESMTVFIASIFPNFVVSLALTAFANGLWMSVGGFLVSSKILNDFWYYTFYWINYQRYVFQGMMFNEFEHRIFDCDSNCHCLYESSLSSQCKIAGTAVLENLGYSNNDKGLWIGILIVLIFVFRLGSYAALKVRK